MAEYKLIREIIVRSETDTWDEAKLEWGLADVFYVDEPETCLCGHYPIKEVCRIRNKHNSQEVTVGNCCVQKFLGLNSDGIFRAIDRVAQDETKALNIETIKHARERNWINDWEYEFYCDTMRKRKLSVKQLAKRIQVNKKVLEHIVKNSSN